MYEGNVRSSAPGFRPNTRSSRLASDRYGIWDHNTITADFGALSLICDVAERGGDQIICYLDAILKACFHPLKLRLETIKANVMPNVGRWVV